MEGDEMEMSKEELQRWISQKVNKSELISPDVLEKCNLLQSLLERREKQAAHLLKLCESVAACEATVKKQYSLLGWEYKDTDSDDDDDITDCGVTPPSPCKSVLSETQVRRSPATNGLTPLLPTRPDRENLNRDNGKKSSFRLREPVVVLTRLPECKISALRPPTPPKHDSENESSSNSDSDKQWEPDDDSSDSDFSISGFKTGSKRRRKIDQMFNVKLAKSHATLQAGTNTYTKSNAAKTPAPLATAKTGANTNAAKTPAPQADRNTNSKRNATKTSTPPANTKGVTPVCIVSALCQSSEEATKTLPSVPQGEVSVNMNVLARRRAMSWQRGKIKEILTKEDGRLKYKVIFEEKGKSLVSGHHIAFDCMPKVEQLFVGARVVVKCQADQPHFCPGVLAELPSRRNRMRFLVFIDDHTPVYVGLPFFRLVCRPLTDPLDDILDDTHKNFMKEYLMSWPYPPQTQYKVGQLINAEFNGVQQKCEVQVVDCSLIQVVFEKDQHKEWIYRGSIRLEHMINMREHLELKREDAQKNKSTSG
ncbi:histone-lysine N-methyltransferase SETDB1-B-like isoform X2 [Xiphias gladius]|nr:histone-lysine N-methyltransferase SETDB1-B-like isoform X2 [Xiphias gladius]XP_039976941.1 histone-lysine N-methyltransferase SETDB1-B-like isoform X2 [Xiphias gladius]XP_039976943.1 histone-lysine N-methyltransferase SETDB1-B-like isoform X2 [Xiphias gladius]XP_039976944.1 histone-lysine N-methyltransferase SETDB1-B-like isoform X2 [Xiphias gladius]